MDFDGGRNPRAVPSLRALMKDAGKTLPLQVQPVDTCSRDDGLAGIAVERGSALNRVREGADNRSPSPGRRVAGKRIGDRT